MLIQELERLTGLDRPTIRYYEREGLITPNRTENGYRSYSTSDAETLIRIKLMRQLGVPIAKIKNLQEGAESFSAVIEAQINVLSSQIDRDKRARNICTAILVDGADYLSIDSAYYLKMFDQPSESTINPSASFQEQLPEQIHPWRRFAARWLDYFLIAAIFDFVFYVLFRIRPFPRANSFMSIIEPIIYAAAFIPLEALFLHLWGTTPGKLAMGIRIERIEGGFLSYADALERSKSVYIAGLGLKIPFLSEIVMLKRYCTLTGRSFWRWARYDNISPPYEMDWDYNNEIHYDERVGKRRIALVCVLVVGFLLFTITTNDSVKPKYRGNQLTVEEFSGNYNNMLNIISADSGEADKLQEDGTWREMDYQTVILYMGGTPEIENKDFNYICNSGVLEAVSYSQKWKDIIFLNPVSSHCYIAAVTLLMSQDNCSFLDLLKFEKAWTNELGKTDVDFQIKNIQVQWEIEADEKLQRSGEMYISSGDNSKDAQLAFSFRVSIVKE